MISSLFLLNKYSRTDVFVLHDETGLPEMWDLIWIPLDAFVKCHLPQHHSTVNNKSHFPGFFAVCHKCTYEALKPVQQESC